MKIIKDAKPPMFEEIAAVFPGARDAGVLFCWGDRIFVPRPSGDIGPELIAHEQVHCDRQGSDVAGWWGRYLSDDRFRLFEEFPAHVAEFEAMCRLHRHKWVSARSMRRTFAGQVARKLASPLYGSLIGFSDAKEMLLRSAREAV